MAVERGLLVPTFIDLFIVFKQQSIVRLNKGFYWVFKQGGQLVYFNAYPHFYTISLVQA